MKNSEEPSSAAPRINCRPTLPVFSANSGEPGTIAGTMISANTRKRSQAISIEGSDAERYFAVTSETPRNTVEDRISAMPLNGRSERAGARETADFFSDGREALSSLAATAAGGGVTANLGREISNLCAGRKRQMAEYDNTRQRDADMHHACNAEIIR